MDKHDEQPEILERYADPTLETLGELLDQLAADGAMDLEELDGFFTALHCAPQLVPREEYLPEIFGSGDALDNDEIFSAPIPPNSCRVSSTTFGPPSTMPSAVASLLFPCCFRTTTEKSMARIGPRDSCTASKCARISGKSFLAMNLGSLGLLRSFHPNPDLRPFKTPLTGKEREILLKEVSRGVSEMYHYFARQRAVHIATEYQQALGASDTAQSIRRIGRNDPCYCGSGLKYKKCCGGIKVN